MSRNIFCSRFAFLCFVDFAYVVRGAVRMMFRGLSSGPPIRDELPSARRAYRRRVNSSADAVFDVP